MSWSPTLLFGNQKKPQRAWDGTLYRRFWIQTQGHKFSERILRYSVHVSRNATPDSQAAHVNVSQLKKLVVNTELSTGVSITA